MKKYNRKYFVHKYLGSGSPRFFESKGVRAVAGGGGRVGQMKIQFYIATSTR